MPRLTSRFSPPVIPLLHQVEAFRRPGETLLDTAERLLTNEALALSAGRQYMAAMRLGVSPARMNALTHRWGQRPKDQRLRP